MHKKQHLSLLSLLALATVLLSGLSASSAFAQRQPAKAGAGMAGVVTDAPARKLSVKVNFAGVVDMRTVPKETPNQASNNSYMPLLTGKSAAQYAAEKAAAAHNASAPTIAHPFPGDHASLNTPIAQKNFNGLANSGSICYYFHGCQPPDMSLASSSQWIMQGVNMSFGVYDTLGNLLSGWPKNFQQFFNVPNPPNKCDPNGPFLYDPRAFYDPNDHRFWAAALQAENALGIGKNCPFSSIYWFAVSQTDNPNGKWNVFFIFEGFMNTVADFTQFGFDGENAYFTSNMFSQDGSSFQGVTIWGGKKSQFEHFNGSFFLWGYGNLALPDGTLVDTVQPVLSEASHQSLPRTALFVSSLNMNSGGGSCLNGCKGVALWVVQGVNTQFQKLVDVVVPTATYTLAPQADQPGCAKCVETLDTRISATPVYHEGLISWALETGATNKSQVVPAIFWGQILPNFVNGQLKGAKLYQSGVFGFQGDQAASFGALMPDYNGDLLMVYDTMGSALDPSIAYTSRHFADAPGSFSGVGNYLQKGVTATKDTRWGDYEATSYDGPQFDHIWFASEYTNKKGDWSTRIGEVQIH